MISRRTFLLALAASSPTLMARERVRARTPRLLHVASLVDEARPDFARGLGFGAREADRSAALFGWRVAQRPFGATDATVLIVATDSAPSAVNTLMLFATCRAPVDALRLVPDEWCPDSSGKPRVALWDPSLRAFGAEQLNARYRTECGREMTSDAWLGWFSMKLITEAALRARTTDARELDSYLRQARTQFDGHKGVPLRFDERGVLVQPVYPVAS